MKQFLTAALTVVPALILSLLFISKGKMPHGGLSLISFSAAYLFFNSMFFMMIYTKKTDRYRSALFVATAFFFVISFIGHMFEERGSMSFTDDALLNCQIPFCHIVTTMVLIPFAFTKTIIFPGSLTQGYAAVGSMIVIWLLSLFTIGRAWCGWACFFGGLDEGFSKILKKPVIKHISPLFKYLPVAVLLLVILTSAYLLQPTYCSWICPFKAVTEYEPITSATSLIKTIIFLSLFIILVVILPILTKKRTQCAFFCPFGAMQSVSNYISPFEIKIDTNKCCSCGLCIANCPSMSISNENLKKGASGISCLRCGKCVDICPKGAAAFHIKGVEAGREELCRILSLYAFFIFMTAFLGGSFTDGFHKILKFITTGSFI